MAPERLSTPRYCQMCGRYLVERYIAAEGRRRLQCEGCGFIHYLNPRVVAAVIVERGGMVLLQQRAIEPRRGFWTFPGGFLEMGETPADGAVRETREEVGLEVRDAVLHGVYARPDVGIVLIVYRGTSEDGEAFVADEESMAVRWYAVTEIPWAKLSSEITEAALRDWVAARQG